MFVAKCKLKINLFFFSELRQHGGSVDKTQNRPRRFTRQSSEISCMVDFHLSSLCFLSLFLTQARTHAHAVVINSCTYYIQRFYLWCISGTYDLMPVFNAPNHYVDRDNLRPCQRLHSS